MCLVLVCFREIFGRFWVFGLFLSEFFFGGGDVFGLFLCCLKVFFWVWWCFLFVVFWACRLKVDCVGVLFISKVF